LRTQLHLSTFQPSRTRTAGAATMRLGQALAALAVSVVGVIGVSDSDAEHAAALMSNVSGRVDDLN
jgi:hypothetical protein